MEHLVNGMLYALDTILTGFGITVIGVGAAAIVYYLVRWAILAGHHEEDSHGL